MHLQWEYRIAGKYVPIFGLVLLDNVLPLNKAIILVRTVNSVMSSRNSILLCTTVSTQGQKLLLTTVIL